MFDVYKALLAYAGPILTGFLNFSSYAVSSQMSASLPNHRHGYTESVPKSSTPHFITIDVSLKPKDHLRVGLYHF